MPYPYHLIRLALAAIRRTEHLEGTFVADCAEAVPKVPRNAAVVRVADGFCQFAVFDQLAVLAAELKFIAIVVNRP